MTVGGRFDSRDEPISNFHKYVLVEPLYQKSIFRYCTFKVSRYTNREKQNTLLHKNLLFPFMYDC